MFNKKIFIILLALASCLAVVSIALNGFINANPDKPIMEYNGEFDLTRYSNYINEFSIEKTSGTSISFKEINTAQDAANDAETIWIDLYGKEQIIKQRPYIVQFDPNNDVWLVRGNEMYLKGAAGGVASTIISMDGELMAVWHEE